MTGILFFASVSQKMVQVPCRSCRQWGNFVGIAPVRTLKPYLANFWIRVNSNYQNGGYPPYGGTQQNPGPFCPIISIGKGIRRAPILPHYCPFGEKMNPGTIRYASNMRHLYIICVINDGTFILPG